MMNMPHARTRAFAGDHDFVQQRGSGLLLAGGRPRATDDAGIE
jgi:hypothetical protein